MRGSWVGMIPLYESGRLVAHRNALRAKGKWHDRKKWATCRPPCARNFRRKYRALPEPQVCVRCAAPTGSILQSAPPGATALLRDSFGIPRKASRPSRHRPKSASPTRSKTPQPRPPSAEQRPANSGSPDPPEAVRLPSPVRARAKANRQRIKNGVEDARAYPRGFPRRPRSDLGPEERRLAPLGIDLMAPAMAAVPRAAGATKSQPTAHRPQKGPALDKPKRAPPDQKKQRWRSGPEGRQRARSAAAQRPARRRRTPRRFRFNPAPKAQPKTRRAPPDETDAYGVHPLSKVACDRSAISSAQPTQTTRRERSLFQGATASPSSWWLR